MPIVPQPTLPAIAQNTAVWPTVATISPLQVIDARTPDQLWFDGFNQYADCVRDGDYLTAEELAAMTPKERQGYSDAISSHDYAEFVEWRESSNSFGDYTMGGY